MKKLIFTILFALISIVSFAQRPIWNNFNSDVMVFSTVDNGRDAVTFTIEDNHNVVFYDIPKLLSALTVCSEVLDQATSLSKKEKNALIQGMDTIFPRASITWHADNVLVMSYNEILRPDIQIVNGQAKLIITGTAVCRTKFDQTMLDPAYSGDANITTDYTIIFENIKDINDLIGRIQSSVSAQNRRFTRMVPNQAFPRVIDRRFRPIPFNTFMNRRRPR